MIFCRYEGEFQKPKGLIYQSDFLSQDEEKQLLGYIKRLDFHQVVMHGQAAKRLVRHFGLGYDFESRRTKPGEPMPQELVELIGRAEAFASVPPGSVKEALVTKYPVGAQIGWHRDAGAFCIVIGISLQAPCIMRFQRRVGEVRQVYERILNPRSIYVMAGESRTQWEHHIPSTKAERYSITFRTIR